MIPTRYLWLPLLVITLSGCAGTFDLFSGTHYSESSKERSPTGQVVERTEYRVTQKGALECYAARRAVERERSVSKRYRRRDGLGRNQYTGFAVGDALVGGLVAGVLAGFCTSDQNDLSCWNMLYASPFAIDLVYAIVRRQTTGEAVLVEKNAFGDRLALGRTALFEERTECESVREVRLGKTSGLSDEERLRTGRHKPRVLRGGSVAVGLSEDFKLSYSNEALRYWLERASRSLWVVDAEGEAHAIAGASRCKVLRANESRLPNGSGAVLSHSCPLPKSTTR